MTNLSSSSKLIKIIKNFNVATTEQNKDEPNNLLVSRCVEPSQLQGIISGLKTKLTSSLSYSARKFLITNHNISIAQFRRHI